MAFEGARPFFHVIVEVQTRDAEARKRRIAMLFALGAAGCVVVTSLGIILFMDRHISRPIKALEASANALARGEPDCCEKGAASCNCLDVRRGDELGNLARAFLSMRDAIRGAIRQLEEANSQLRQLDQLKSDFLSSVSHELRTPLTSLLGYAKLTARHFTRHFQPLANGDEMLARKADTIAGNLAVMVSEGERLTRLINDVLDLNKIESGRMPWRDATLACREVMDRVARTVEPLARQHPRVRLLLPSPEPELAIHADPDSVQQLLLNLLHNAFKFTRQGSITLMARPGAEGFVVFTVADTGMGIAQADLPRLFDKFSQAHGGDTMPDAPAGVEGVGGSGLGLAICKEIVTHYGGVIWVESRLGAGSAFHCTLPRASLPAGDRPAGD